MKTSVVLTTYNGVKYLPEQLDSLRLQTRQPDEVIVCDDCSCDATVKMVTEYIADNFLQNWKLIKNRQNKGWKKNFMDAIDMASGELVFLCDQDDVWHRDKIGIMAQVLENEPDALLVICGFQKILTDGDINCKEPSMKYHKQSDNIPQGYPGCCFCFRKAFFDRVKNAWFEKAAHDLFIRLAAWMLNGVYVCEDTLHYFRRHENSATAARHWKSDPEERKGYVETVLLQYNALAEIIEENAVSKRYSQFLKKRYRMLDTRSAAEWLGLLPYRGFYAEQKHLLADLISILRK